jgi:SulP family sulfate permease
MIVGLVEVLLAVSFAALIFSGPLSTFVAQGIGLGLSAAIIAGLVIGLLSSLPGTVSGNQDIPAAIMAVTAPAIVAAMPAAATGRDAYVTVAVAIGLTTVLAGVFFYGLGHFRLGSLVRFLPYPVVGGFLAGTGWLLMHGAMGIMIDVVPPLTELPLLFEQGQLLRWFPGVILAVLLLVVLERVDSGLALPGMALGAIVLFHIAMALRGAGLATLTAEGWLLGPFPTGQLWPALLPSDLAQVYWPAIAGQVVSIATIWLMSTVALLLNASGLELTTGREMDLDRELRAAGAANIAGGLGGGFTGYHQFSLSAMNYKMGAGSRLPAIVAVVLCLLVLFLGGSVLSLFPRVVLGGLMFFLGLSFVLEWAIQTWFVLPRTDYAIILVILLITAVVGFMEAVAAGLLVAVALFVVNYSRIDVVRDELTGRHIQSRVTRPPQERKLLQEHGDKLHILHLQGYIFFGTADRLLGQVREQLENAEGNSPRFLLLDFQRVTGIDSTALYSFRRMCQLASTHSVSLVLTGLSPGIERQLCSADAVTQTAIIFPDLDRGCEWCEGQILKELGMEYNDGNSLRQELLRILQDEAVVRDLLSYLERQEVAVGDYLMRQGDEPDVLYLIESGRVTAQLEQEGSDPARLQTMEGGHVLGELGFFLGTERTAAVVAEMPGVVYRLSQEGLERMCRNDPAVASAFHQLIVHLLAERVVHLVSVVQALQQ